MATVITTDYYRFTAMRGAVHYKQGVPDGGQPDLERGIALAEGMLQGDPTNTGLRARLITLRVAMADALVGSRRLEESEAHLHEAIRHGGILHMVLRNLLESA